MTKPNHYITKEEFISAIEKYHQEKIDHGVDRPKTRTYEFLGKCFMQIAQKLSNAHNFRGYPFKEEMILDGIEVCVRRLDNFSLEISQNPFAYFTQLCWFAFVNRIKIEDKMNNIKSSLILNSGVLDDLPVMLQGDDTFDSEGAMQYLLEHVSKPKNEIDPIHKKTTKAYQAKLKEQAELEVPEVKPKKKRAKKLSKAEMDVIKELDEKINKEEILIKEEKIHDFSLDWLES
jgi:hypothetical protein